MRLGPLYHLLATWDLPSDPALFYGEGWALLANLVNLSAKTIDRDWYSYKNSLIRLALEECLDCWIDEEGIAYVETCVGQVSFHLVHNWWYEDEDEFEDLISYYTGRSGVWDQGNTQEHAPELVAEFLGVAYTKPSIV